MNCLDELAQKYQTDKRIGLHGYTRTYERMFFTKRMDIHKVLEIGIYTGASIRMWLDYFPNSKVWGIDQMEAYCHYWDGDPRVECIFGDANKPELWQGVPDDFDLIVEDASHIPSEQIKMFELGFPHVVPGGYYIIEDTQTSFYVHNTDKLFRYFYNRMLDLQVNGFHLGDFYVARKECIQSMSELAKQIYSIQFYKSLIVVEKAEELWQTNTHSH